jgi:hypothetical protein
LDAGLDFTLFRLAVVIADGTPPPDKADIPAIEWPYADLACIAESDTVTAFARAALHAPEPGVRVMNLVSPYVRSSLTTAEVLDRLPSGKRPLAPYRGAAGSRAGLYDVGAAVRYLGFEPQDVGSW